MAKIKVGVAGYGTIGQRLADGVAMQDDMELVGIADLAPTLSLQALRERDMIGANGVEYKLYLVDGADEKKFEEKKIPAGDLQPQKCPLPLPLVVETNTELACTGRSITAMVTLRNM